MAKAQETLPDEAKLLNVEDVAVLLRCSTRSVWRMSKTGRMPHPLKLGGAVRWSRAAVEQWVKNGCPGGGTADAKGGK